MTIIRSFFKSLVAIAVSVFFVLLILTQFIACSRLLQAPIDAATAYQNKQYAVAAKLYTDEYQRTEQLIKKSEIAYKIAESYRLSNRTSEAEQWFSRALEYASDPATTYKYGLMLKANGKYDEAIAIFNEYGLNNPADRTRAARAMQACKQAREWLKMPTNYKVVNLWELNSPASDFAPVLYQQNNLVFTSARATARGSRNYGWTGEKHTDLFIATTADFGKTFSTPTQLPDSINTEFIEGTATFNNSFTEIYFAACGSPNHTDDYCQLYHAYKTSDGKNWLKPQPVVLFDDATINVAQPFLSPTGKDLYFVADAPQGFGNKDIYVAHKNPDGSWGNPENLGPEINTDGYDGFPALGADGRLYFASDGHLGMGGLDVFAATWETNRWVNPQNLQAPINSPADDFGLILDPAIDPSLLDDLEQTGYFASAREGGNGNDDIYRILLEIPKTPATVDTPIIAIEKPKTTVYILQGQVFENQLTDPANPNSAVLNQIPLPSAVAEVLGLSTNSNIARRIVTNAKGQFNLTLEPNTDYKLTASQQGFFTKSSNVSTKGKTPLNTTAASGNDTVYVSAQIALDRIFKQKEVVLKNIYYDFDKADIREDARPTLDALAAMLFENPNIRIELGSHTDARGSDRYNLELSQRRAQSAVDYLLLKGIDTNRIIARGYGETQLVNDCRNGVDCTDEEHEQNRRTTFRVL